MPNINTLFSGSSSNKKKKDDSDDDDDNNNNEDNRYVGGIDSRGGGSGLAVQPNPNDRVGASTSSSLPNFFLGENTTASIDSVFNRAEQDSTIDDNDDTAGANATTSVRRTITMYRSGFIVDDGPYRRLDDPSNADFLRSLAMGRTPRELAVIADSNDTGDNTSGKDVVVGLIDKRSEEYVEKFQSFSGQGSSLVQSGESSSSSGGIIFDPTLLLQEAADTTTTTNSEATTMTSIAVRLLNGKRLVVKVSIQLTIRQLAIEIIRNAPTGSTIVTEPFRLVSGYPPQPFIDDTITIENAKLQNAQVQIQKV